MTSVRSYLSSTIQTLVANRVTLPNDGFGGKNCLSLNGNLAAVGAPGAELAFLYRRSAVPVSGGGGSVKWEWGQLPVETFVSSDFDYDVVHLQRIVHRQVGTVIARTHCSARNVYICFTHNDTRRIY